MNRQADLACYWLSVNPPEFLSWLHPWNLKQKRLKIPNKFNLQNALVWGIISRWWAICKYTLSSHTCKGLSLKNVQNQFWSSLWCRMQEKVPVEWTCTFNCYRIYDLIWKKLYSVFYWLCCQAIKKRMKIEMSLIIHRATTLVTKR